MEARYDERILKNEKSFSNGHRVDLYVEVDNSSVRKPSYLLNTNFFTKCEEHSTSWDLRIFIQPVKVNESVDIPVTLKRCDSKECLVDASIDVSFSCRGEYLHGLPRYFEKPKMVSGDKLYNIITGFPQPSKHRTLFDDIVTIHAIVDIRDCHGVVNTLHEEKRDESTHSVSSYSSVEGHEATKEILKVSQAKEAPSITFSNQGQVGIVFHSEQDHQKDHLPPKHKKGVFSSFLRKIQKRKN